MRLSTVLLLATLMQVSAAGFAQRINLRKQKVSLDYALEEIRKQSGYDFFYDSKIISKDKKVDVDLRNASIEEAMSHVLWNLPLSFEVRNTEVTIKRKDNPSFLERLMLNIRAIDVRGRVTDNKGTPLPGASVKAASGKSVSTNTNGDFFLSGIQEGERLSISFIGYQTKEFLAKTDLGVIALELSESQLDDIVVVGYGTSRRKDFTGSVSSLKLEDSPLAQLPRSNALEAIKGSLPGIDIGPSNRAGGQPSMQIRGQNSIRGSNDPLIVLDGVIYLGSIADINPNDIASFDVLKDATSAAAYGSRSANGVIAITTKKGKMGKPVISFNSTTGAQYWQSRPEMLKGSEWIAMVNARNSYSPGSTEWMKPGEIDNMNAGRERAWLDEVTRTGIIQNNQIAVSGAAEKINYYVSTSYDKNNAIVVGDNFDRISVLGKLKTDITNWLSIGVDASYSRRDYSGFEANVGEAQRMSPYGVMYRDDFGNLEKYPYTQAGVNPLWGVNDDTRSNIDIQNNYRLNTNARITVPWISGLSYQVNFMNNSSKNGSGSFTNERYYIQEGNYDDLNRYSPAKVQGFLASANGNLNRNSSSNYVFDNIINYKQNFAKHDIDLTLVATLDKQKYESINSMGSNYVANGNTVLDVWGLHKATVQRIDLDYSQRANIGYLARANYNFSNKYFFTGSIRRDGASVFGAERKWANFLGAGLAWRISEETFLKSFNHLNNLKLKLSYGQNGNQGVEPFGTLSTVANGASGGSRYEFSNAPAVINYGLFQSTLGNAELGWEKTSSWNLGFESAWLNNRLFLDMEYYSAATTDQIFTRNIPVMTGFKTIQTSMGQVDNRGLEATIRSVNVRDKEFNWSSSVMLWKNVNKLVRLYGIFKDGKEENDLANNLFIGQPLGAIYGYQQDGIVQVGDTEYISLTGAQPGSPKYKDIDGIPGLSPADRTILGSALPNFRLNVSNTITYKEFDFYLMVTGTFGGDNTFLRSNTGAFMTSGTSRFNDNIISIPSWTAENQSNTYPSSTFAGDGRFLGLKSRAFVRIQDATMSYRLKKEWLEKIRLASFKVFISAQNLGTFTKWVGGDPETGTTVGANTFPVPSTYSIGANITF